MANRKPENCPRKLPHAYEGSGSGFSGDDYFSDPGPDTNTNTVLTPAPGAILFNIINLKLLNRSSGWNLNYNYVSTH